MFGKKVQILFIKYYYLMYRGEEKAEKATYFRRQRDKDHVKKT